MTTLSNQNSTFFSLRNDGFDITSFIVKKINTLNDEQINKLLALGGKLEDVIYGLACSGNTIKVKHFLEHGDLNKKALLSYAVKGYARAGNLEEIYRINNYQMYLKDMVVGLAQAGKEVQVRRILDDHTALYAQAVEGYAEGNHKEYLLNLVQGTNYYPTAIYHAAKSGYPSLVQDLLAQRGVTCDMKIDLSLLSKDESQINAYSLLNHALQGYISGGHFTEAASLLARGASVSQALAAMQDTYGINNPIPFYVLLNAVKDKAVKERLVTQSKSFFNNIDTSSNPDLKAMGVSDLNFKKLVEKVCSDIGLEDGDKKSLQI